jgi:hypothetical protein
MIALVFDGVAFWGREKKEEEDATAERTMKQKVKKGRRLRTRPDMLPQWWHWQTTPS